MRSLFYLLLIGTLPGSAAPAESTFDLSATGISFPFFDAAGNLTHRLRAAHGTKVGDVRELRDVHVQYFSGSSPNVVVQELKADEATWDERTERLTGRGSVAIATEENQVSGEGFDFALATSVLHVHHHFVMTNPELVVTSDRATVELVVEKSGEKVTVRDVKRCEAVGHLEIVVQPTATHRYRFDRVVSVAAIYDGPSQTVTFPQPIRSFRNGRETVGSDKLTINLKRTAEGTGKTVRP